MKRQDYPIYHTAVQFYLSSENQSFTRLIEHPNLSQTEKILLTARKHFSACEFKEAIEILQSVHSSCDFLMGEKFLLLATAHSNLGESENSFLYNGQAIEYYRLSGDQRGQFLSTYNLSVDAGNLGLQKISLEKWQKAASLAACLEEKLLVHRAQACALSAQRKYSEAVNAINMTLELCEREQTIHTNKLDVLTLKVVASDIFFRAGKLAQAREILESIRHERLVKLKARVFFNLSLLKFLEGHSLDNPAKIVAESSEYSLKWEIIRALETGDITYAQNLWSKLLKAFPNNFKADFEAASEFDSESLFFSAVKKMREHKKIAAVLDFPVGSKLLVLHETLSHAKAPIRKEELIEKVWDCPYDPSLESRFYKLIQRLKEMQLPVQNKRRAYYYKTS